MTQATSRLVIAGRTRPPRGHKSASCGPGRRAAGRHGRDPWETARRSATDRSSGTSSRVRFLAAHHGGLLLGTVGRARPTGLPLGHIAIRRRRGCTWPRRQVFKRLRPRLDKHPGIRDARRMRNSRMLRIETWPATRFDRNHATDRLYELSSKRTSAPTPSLTSRPRTNGAHDGRPACSRNRRRPARLTATRSSSKDPPLTGQRPE